MQQAQSYYIPQPSTWPIIGACALLFMGFGAAFTFNGIGAGPWLLTIGFAILVYLFFGWFGEVARESEKRMYSHQVDVSFRWGMSWFIFSEVMFFAAFFGALFYVRILSVPDLALGASGEFLWPGFSAKWPASGPGIEETFTPTRWSTTRRCAISN